MLSIVVGRRVHARCHRDKNPRSEPRGQHCGGVIRNKRNDCIHHWRDTKTFAMPQQERNDESQSGKRDERPHGNVACPPPKPRKRKNESAEIKAVRAVKEEVKEAKKTRKAKDDKPSKPAKATVAAKPAKATAPAKAAKAPKTAVAAKPAKAAKAAKPATEKKSTKKK